MRMRHLTTTMPVMTGESDEQEDDDNDGLVDEQGGMSAEELASLEESMKPI